MLNIKGIGLLAKILETTPKHLKATLADPRGCYKEFLLIDPAKPGKKRTVLDVQGPVRRFQQRLHQKLLLPRLKPSPYSHGGIRARSIKTNAQVHIRSQFLMKADIANFYPSVKSKRIYHLFTEAFGCSPDVARLCTKLCTYDYHLALGLVTSPILADKVLGRVDQRIGSACKKAGLQYTRFVDDITISGRFDLMASGVRASITTILSEHGFTVHPEKWEFGHVDGGPSITGVCVRNGRIDLPRSYIAGVKSQIEDITLLANGVSIDRPYVTRSQLLGRIGFVRWINPRQGLALRKQAKALNWDKALRVASNFGLVTAKKSLVAKRHFIVTGEPHHCKAAG